MSRLTAFWLLVGCTILLGEARAEGLTAARLGVVFKLDDSQSERLAALYATQRGIPLQNVIGLRILNVDVLPPDSFAALRGSLLDQLPTTVESILLVWSKPYAVGCMSITTAFAAGYRPGFCEPGCSRTLLSPLFDSAGWLPADTVGWYPAMLLPTDDEALAHDIIRRGMAADFSAPPGTLYMVRTTDRKRNVRADFYAGVMAALGNRLRIEQSTAPPPAARKFGDAIGYFTGAERVDELPRLHFLPGALADHLTSSGGVLDGLSQMPATAWLKQGATASYGTVSEPCAFVEKFPNVEVLFQHYHHGETALEAYWKSVAMPGQGLFIGEPLARPYAGRER